MSHDSESKEEFVRLIKDNEGIIHKVIGLYIDNHEDKRDLYQEVLLQTWKSFSNFRGASKFSTWLYKVALNTTLSFKRKDRPNVELTNQRIEQQGAAAQQKENYEILYFLVRQLDEIDRMLMTLHLDGYSNPEISEITGMTSNNVAVKIHRLKSKIIEQFKKHTDGPS